MKILQVIYALSSGGAERLTVDLSNRMAASGHRVTLCVIRDFSVGGNDFYLKDVSPEVEVVNLGIPEGFSVRYFTEIGSLIRRVGPDVVHGHLATINYLMVLRPFFPRTKFVHTIHNDAPAQNFSKFEYVLRTATYFLGCVKAVTISDETTRSFERYYHQAPHAQIYNGRSSISPSDGFGLVKGEIDGWKTTGRETVFLHAGRCVPQKNQSMLVEAFNQLKREGESVVLLVLGAGFDSEEGRKLQAAAGDHIHFLGARNDIGDFYFACEAFCLSSIHEGMPITIIEALSCGCVPVCTPVGGTIDVVQDGSTGFLSTDLTVQAYVVALKRYLSARADVRRETLRESFANRFSIEVCADAYLELFQR